MVSPIKLASEQRDFSRCSDDVDFKHLFRSKVQRPSERPHLRTRSGGICPCEAALPRLFDSAAFPHPPSDTSFPGGQVSD